ncbi:MAG: hypothetical protein DRQ01_08555 [Ignavibacteriae bacterium]|nr:MAG: hypothetical protein DRQ01_08555 [Ignavibacteriota bacterium]
MPSYPELVEAYLKRQSPNPWKLEWLEKKGISNIIVVPAIAEFENMGTLLTSLVNNKPDYFSTTLVIFVINNKPTDCKKVKVSNKKSLKLLRSIIQQKDINDPLVRKVIDSGLSIALIDAYSKGKELSEKDSGVGLARKIGLDLALTAFDYSIEKKEILFWLDADCIVDPNYINTVVDEFNNKKLFAATINFSHDISGTDELTKAIIPYEIFLRSYVLGLKHANSPYAFHTIGSTISIDHNAYIKAGGMNKKKAAEDFYFLQKVAKNYKINKIVSTTVYPSSRHSWRVPFGTGKSITRFLSNNKNEYLLNDPVVFDVLKKWLILFNDKNNNETKHLMGGAGKINKELEIFLIQRKFPEQWDSILKNSKNSRQLQYQKLNWFDGFKTLKLVHHLRDSAYPEINMFDAVDQLLIKTGKNIIKNRTGESIPELDVQREYLYKLREIDN